MIEESTEPDWDGILARLDGAPSPDELREARDDGARAMMDALLGVALRPRCGVSEKAIREIGFRVMSVAYLANHPITQQVRNMEDLAERCGMSGRTSRRIIASITSQIGVLESVPGSHRAHRKR